MDITTWFIIGLTLLDVVTYFIYNWETWKGNTKPQNWLLWSLWTYLASLNAWSYLVSTSDPIKTILAWENTVMTIVTLGTVIYHGKIADTPIAPSKKISAVLCVIAGLLFFVFRQAAHANFLLQAGTAVSMFTLFSDLRKDPRAERALPWGLWTIVYVGFVVLVLCRWRGQWGDLVYPLNFAILHAIVFFLSSRTPKVVRVSLFGTMATAWREPVRAQLLERGFVPIDNTDERWNAAETAEAIAPLLKQDHNFMRDSDIVLWHHDSGTPGNTARIELGFLTLFGRPTVVHVEPEVVSRKYMRALCLLYPKTLHWAETMDDALEIVARLATTSHK
ncbi:hypothetical protein KBA73_05525 [Patescibacteria group bacterium]|nr:hypothetical protein [Patescibacteria group bacterium]